MTTRRRFLQAGLAGLALLATAHWIERALAGPDSMPAGGFLDARGAALVRALAPVVLSGALPADAKARGDALQAIVEAFDRAASGLDAAVRAEIGELVSLLVFPPTRIAIAGVWNDWPQASGAEIAAFLDDWRASRFEIKRSGYRALCQLIQASWYDNPLAWPIIAYPGPPKL